jgi:hypothetical protein
MHLSVFIHLIIESRQAVKESAFWSRKKGTVRQQLGIFKEQVAIGERHGITMTPPCGPFMIEIQRRLELDWIQALERNYCVAMREVAEHAVYFLFWFCGALRGFEGTKVPLHELRSKVALDASRSRAATDSLGRFMPHVGIPLVGAFKARSVGNTELLIFVAAQTASGLRPGEWTKRLVDLLTTLGIVNGFALFAFR